MHSILKKPHMCFQRCVRFAFLIILLSSLSSGMPVENAEMQVPGDPLNPDDFAAGKIYYSGLIQEAPDDPTKELAPKDSDAKGLTWDGGMIPYTLAEKFDGRERTIIASAISEYQPRTCLTFTPRTSEADYVNIIRGNLGAGCYSMVGRQGGPQTLQVGPDCMKRGSIIHEFLHVAGFAHEHQRKDRDENIEINFKYIRENLKIQFRLLEKTHNTITAYDYNSIVHYSATADCISPCPEGVKTITPKKDPNAQLGQRKGLSSLDIEKTNVLYKCPRPSAANDASSQASNQVMGWIPIIGQNLKSFKGCQDFDERCSFVDVSDCSKNSTWINFTCRKTCGYCDSDCNDYNIKCDQWSRQNQCLEYPQYMLTYCQRSCGLCSAGD